MSIDHRRGAAFAPGELVQYFRAGFDLDQDIRTYVEVVHRLGELGAVCTHVGHGVSRDGFDAEWRGIDLLTVDNNMVNRCEVFDEADLDTAIARFEQLGRPTPRLENAASQAFQRVESYIAARDWDSVAEIAAENFSVDDRRRVVNAGIRYGRDAAIRESQSLADVGFTLTTVGVMATRGARLALVRVRASASDPEAILSDAPNLVEIDADGRIVAIVIFDLDDFDAAIAELEARYLAGEAAAHTHTWSLVAGGYAGFNRRELFATTPDWVSIDHRRGAGFAPGDMIAYIQAAWDDSPDTKIYIAAAHRLSEIGAVVTHVARGISQEGFDAEWRDVYVLAVEGDMFSRSELFDEVDLDAALARFDELHPQAPRLENAASRVDKRFQACFAARDWDVMAKMLSDGFSIEDRRRVVNMGNLQGRDAELGVHAYAVGGSEHVQSTVIATRAQRLALSHYRFSDRDQRPDAFRIEMLVVVEIDADERMAAVVVFDADNIDAAIAELDARYAAGEAAAHAHTWSVISGSYAAINRNEMPLTTPDCVNIDHRRETAFGPGDLIPYLRAGLELDQDINIYVEAVHRLTDPGAVVTYAAYETSQEGFDAEWRGIAVLTVEGEMVSRTEVFDEADLDAAIARFEELSRPVPRLENTASQVGDRFLAHFAAGDWDAMSKILADNLSNEDRRRVISTGIFDGRDAQMANTRAIAELWSTNVTRTVMATRGRNLSLARVTYSRGDGVEAFLTETLTILEISADERISAIIVFDVDDFDAAIAELDARYLAGEAAAHSETWLAIAEVYAALNRAEMPTTAPGLVDIDHRSLAAIGSGDLMAYVQAALKDARRHRIYVETVHRLTDLGAVTTHLGKATSREGFDAEWRLTGFFIVDGDLINRYEIFDEADLEAALARFDELHRQPPRLENTAAQAYKCVQAHFAARDWDAMAEALAADISTDDRRRVVGEGRRLGRDAVIAEISALTEIGVKSMTPDTIAIRGGHLVLSRVRSLGRDQRHDAFRTEVLDVLEIDADGRVVARVVFDPDDFDAAIAELDSRYLAGEAAPHSAVWSTVTQGYAALNRHERPLMTPDVVSVDHRRGRAFAPGDLPVYLDASWELLPQSSLYIDDVHRLNDIGVVVTHVVHGTTADGFVAEWREVNVLKVAGDRVSRCEMFDEEDFDAALAKFEELSPREGRLKDMQPRATRLENPASRMVDQFLARFAGRDWDAMAELLDDEICTDDRRRVINAGIRRGRDFEMANWHAAGDIWSTDVRPAMIATRGEHLALFRFVLASQDRAPEAFSVAALATIEINDDHRITAAVVFETDDIDAAFEELDARYLAGEAAEDAPTWSAIAGMYTSFNRHELPATTPDWVTVDRRPGATFEFRDASEFFRSTWDLTLHVRIYAEAVHRLATPGAVVTHVVHGTSEDGFDAEWRMSSIVSVKGDLISGCELFEEADLDVALARFEELRPRSGRLEHPVQERFLAHFAARDWDAMGQVFADDYYCDDRRRVVNAGVRHGRDAAFEDLRVAAEIGLMTNITSDIIATRGEGLFLGRTRWLGPDQRPGDFYTEVLNVIETDPEERIAAQVLFDPNDVGAAIKELDARYLAGDAAAYAHTWSLVADAFAAINRHELPELSSDWINVDHRRGAAFAPGEMTAYLHDLLDDVPDIHVYVESLHRLDSLGAVVTQAGHGTSQEGFQAEWREIGIFVFHGDLLSRYELFDETDLDSALARFDELQSQAPRLENAASQVHARLRACVAARDWNALTEILADDITIDDRRRAINSGIQYGRDAAIADMRGAIDLGLTNISLTVIATRGVRLELCRMCISGEDRPDAFRIEFLSVVEINADERIMARVAFDLDDIDAAFEELEARYLVGEGAAHAHAWSVVSGAYASMNRHELFATTPDWVNMDHRRPKIIEQGGLNASLLSMWALIPDVTFRVEAVHRLTNVGAICTHVAQGISQDGFDAEWRGVELLTVDGDLINRCEIFDERELDAAITRFDELQPQAPRLENAASQVEQRFLTYFAARDWDAYAEQLSDGVWIDDRRHVVNAGVRHGRDAEIANVRALADIGVRSATLTVIAIRGGRLFLGRHCVWGGWSESKASETLCVLEINAENQIAARVLFDVDDVDAALAELDARYLAGEAAAHAQTWSLVMQAQAAWNRHELFANTEDWENIDHRRGRAYAPGELKPFLLATWNVIPDAKLHTEAVHRMTNSGVVSTVVATGTSQEGFDAEWREIALLTFDGDLISRCELFDEADLAAALVRFDELDRPASLLDNAATRIWAHMADAFNRRHVEDFLALSTANIRYEDRRKGLRDEFEGSSAQRKAVLAMFEASPDSVQVTAEPIAIRGSRLALNHVCFRDTEYDDRPITVEMLQTVEVSESGLLHLSVSFDPDDVDAAFVELEARYLAGDAATDANTWSVIARTYAAFNQHEFASTAPDPVYVDHRSGVWVDEIDVAGSIRAVWDLTPDVRICIEAVHRLSELGAVVTAAMKGTSPEGFDAEWQMIDVFAVEGDRLRRIEVFDESDLDAAVARFEELSQPSG